MLFKTKRLSIRHIEPDDWQSIKVIWCDFNSSPFSRYDMPHNTENYDVRERIAKWAEASNGTEHIFFAVCLEETVIGFCSFNIRKDSHEISYCFHSAYHGKGYAKESLSAIIEYLQTIGISKFTAGTALNNVPSVSLLKSLGFRLTGTEKVSFYKDEHGNDIFFEGGNFELN